MFDKLKKRFPVLASIVGRAVDSRPLVAAARDVVAEAIAERIDAKGGLPLTKADAGTVAATAGKKLEETPEGQYAAGEDSGWRSRANWAKWLALASPLLGLVGFKLSEEQRSCIALLGSDAAVYVGAGVILVVNAAAALFAHGERKATKPLGT